MDLTPGRGEAILFPPGLLDRMVQAVERVQTRLLRPMAALESAGLPYAVCGEQAVAAWVISADESTRRSTPEVEILMNRTDLPGATTALNLAGFSFRRSSSGDGFVEGPEAR